MKHLRCSNIIQRMAKDYSITQIEAEPYVYATIDTIVKLIAEGNQLHIQGLGKFLIKEMKPKRIIHPVTQEEMIIPPRCQVDFSPVYSLRQTVAKLPLKQKE